MNIGSMEKVGIRRTFDLGAAGVDSHGARDLRLSQRREPRLRALNLSIMRRAQRLKEDKARVHEPTVAVAPASSLLSHASHCERRSTMAKKTRKADE